MSSMWDDARRKAQKTLGGQAKVPELPDTIKKASDSFSKAKTDFKPVRDSCEQKLSAVVQGNDAVMNAAKQFKATIQKSDFELDPKKDAKKIADARKQLTEALDDAISSCQTNAETLSEFVQMLARMGKMKV